MEALFVIDRMCRDDKQKPASAEVRSGSAFEGLLNAALKRKHRRNAIIRLQMQIGVSVVRVIHSHDKKLDIWKLLFIHFYEHILHFQNANLAPQMRTPFVQKTLEKTNVKLPSSYAKLKP
jgi:hypothetical protein